MNTIERMKDEALNPLKYCPILFGYTQGQPIIHTDGFAMFVFKQLEEEYIDVGDIFKIEDDEERKKAIGNKLVSVTINSRYGILSKYHRVMKEGRMTEWLDLFERLLSKYDTGINDRDFYSDWLYYAEQVAIKNSNLRGNAIGNLSPHKRNHIGDIL